MPFKRYDRPVILGLVGDSASGKTTMTNGIARILGEDRVAAIRTDDYHIYSRAERRRTVFRPLTPRPTTWTSWNSTWSC